MHIVLDWYRIANKKWLSPITDFKSVIMQCSGNFHNKKTVYNEVQGISSYIISDWSHFYNGTLLNIYVFVCNTNTMEVMPQLTKIPTIVKVSELGNFIQYDAFSEGMSISIGSADVNIWTF